MFTDVYVGLVKTERFDYDKEGTPYGYSPDYALESLKVGKKPLLPGESVVYWDIVGHSEARKTDWGCWVVKMTGAEMVDYLSREKFARNRFAKFVVAEIEAHLSLQDHYLLTALESPGLG